jgi:hypothetical protein
MGRVARQDWGKIYTALLLHIPLGDESSGLREIYGDHG